LELGCARNRPGKGQESVAKLKLDRRATVLFNVRNRTNQLVSIRAKSKELSPEGGAMQLVFGAEWSGLNSRSGSASMNANILSNFGLGLRGLYQDLTKEPVPDFLAVFIRELEDREQRANR
jgi:hypothetical protein